MEFAYDPGTGKVQIDGVDLTSCVRRVTVDSHVGRQPEVFLELVQGAEHEILQGDGVVHVVRDQADPATIVQWLAGVDAQVLEQEVLQRSSGFGTASTGQLFLEVLQEMVSG